MYELFLLILSLVFFCKCFTTWGSGGGHIITGSLDKGVADWEEAD